MHSPKPEQSTLSVPFISKDVLGWIRVVNKLPLASLIFTNDQSDNQIYLIYISSICKLNIFFHYLQILHPPTFVVCHFDSKWSFCPLSLQKKLQRWIFALEISHLSLLQYKIAILDCVNDCKSAYFFQLRKCTL